MSEDSVPGGARKVECYKVEFEAANQPQHRRIVWIAKDSYLIRQVFESKRIVRRSAATRRASGSNSLTVETVLSYAPELDVDIPIERFTFRAPDSSEEMDDGLNGDRESDSRVTSTIELLDGTTLDDWVLYTAQRGVRKDAVCRIEDGVLRTNGQIRGCLQTKRWYSDYVLEAEWRWEQGLPGGDGGVLVHATAPLVFEGWSRSLEIELATGNAGDFWVVGGGVDIRVEDEELRRAWPWAGDEHSHRRIRNLTDGSEKPIGEWNHLQVTCDEGEVTVFINGEFANRGTNCTETEGAIALKLEGTPIQFRSIRLKPLPR
ncbi:MAG: DUF1080 domain-containing protein [Actinomycetia bacterium]|nr:DUF1080 domain-containing protein [Actinomycetes bacterium]